MWKVAAKAFITATLLLTVLSYWASLGWLSDLTSHFRLQYGLVLVAGFVFAVRCWRKPLWMLFILTGIILNLSEVLPVYSDKQTSLPVQHQLKILHINVLLKNNQYQQVAKLIHESKADIVSLQEVDPAWLAKIEAAIKPYPYQIKHIRPNRFFGIALFSRIPLENAEVRFLGEVKRPNLIANVRVSKQPITIIATHPNSPTRYPRYIKRNQQLMALAELTAQGGPFVVLGDLNTSPYSNAFKQFIQRGHLQDSRQGFGYQGSWPSYFPPAAIPIDHILVSPEIQVLHRKIGPFVGSDHLPVMILLGLRQ